MRRAPLTVGVIQDREQRRGAAEVEVGEASQQAQRQEHDAADEHGRPGGLHHHSNGRGWEQGGGTARSNAVDTVLGEQGCPLPSPARHDVAPETVPAPLTFATETVGLRSASHDGRVEMKPKLNTTVEITGP